jgi:hypothetical protein
MALSLFLSTGVAPFRSTCLVYTTPIALLLASPCSPFPISLVIFSYMTYSSTLKMEVAGSSKMLPTSTKLHGITFQKHTLYHSATGDLNSPLLQMMVARYQLRGNNICIKIVWHEVCWTIYMHSNVRLKKGELLSQHLSLTIKEYYKNLQSGFPVLMPRTELTALVWSSSVQCVN